MTTVLTYPEPEVIELTQTTVLRDLDARCYVAGLPFSPRPRFVWRGPATDPVFVLKDSRESVWEHLDVVCETPCEAVFVCERTRSGAGVIPSTMHQWRDVRIFGKGNAATGFLYRSTVDANNEHGRFDAVSVYGCVVGWSFSGSQSKEHLLTHCRFESGIAALASDSGFQWIGGIIAVCDTGIFLTRVGEPVVLQGVGFETCKRLLLTVNASTASQPVALLGCRYEADQLHDDGDAVVLRHAGPLRVVGSRLGGGRQRIPRIALLGIGSQTAEISGNTFGAFGANKVCPVRASNPTLARIDWGLNDYQRTEAEIAKDGQNIHTQQTWSSTRYI